MRVSVIIPVFNGMSSIGELVEEVFARLSGRLHEVILVNDGSSDRSEQVCEEIALRRDGVLLLSLRKNFGEHNAVICGLSHMTGEAAVIIDDDFQNPPEEILELIHELEKGFDVVYSRYEAKRHSWWRNAGSRFNDRIATVLLNKPRELYLSSFKAIRREVVDEIVRYKGPFPYIDGLILRVTNNIGVVTVRHSARRQGRSNYTLARLVSLYMNMFLNFSVLPLRIFTFIGFAMFILGSLFTVAIAIEKIASPNVPLGWPSVMTGIVMFSGFQMMFLGLIGEYLGKQYLTQNGTPAWVVKRRVEKNPSERGPR